MSGSTSPGAAPKTARALPSRVNPPSALTGTRSCWCQTVMTRSRAWLTQKAWRLDPNASGTAVVVPPVVPSSLTSLPPQVLVFRVWMPTAKSRSLTTPTTSPTVSPIVVLNGPHSTASILSGRTARTSSKRRYSSFPSTRTARAIPSSKAKVRTPFAASKLLGRSSAPPASLTRTKCPDRPGGA